MDMDGCEKCQITGSSTRYLDCEQFAVYSYLCQAMPDMYQCAEWKTFCDVPSNKDLSYCQVSSGQAPPAMKMYFHFGFSEYVLFQSFVPRTPFQYFLAWMFCFALAFFYEGLLAFGVIAEKKWADGDRYASCFPAKVTPLENDDATLTQYSTARGLSIASQRALLKFVTSTVGYAVMLLTMLFNVGLYFAVVVGLAFGTFIFAGYKRRALLDSNSDSFKENRCCP